jgi:hypothetical protein
MALVVSEFTYNGKLTTVPFVVGPAMIQAKMQNVPNGMAITDTLVAGIHPYTGGKFALTVILGQVRRDSYAKGLLEVVENVSHAFPIGAALEPHLKVAGAVMAGIDSLFGMSETKAIAGHRWEYNDGISPWLQPGFFALIDADEKNLNQDHLCVVGGRLKDGVGKTAPGFRRADFMLYSLRVVERRNDVEELPFYNLFKRALVNAAGSDKDSWDRARAGLVALYQEMLVSPDLTWNQVQLLIEEFKERLTTSHKLSDSFMLGDGREQHVTLLDAGSFSSEESAARLDKLRDISSLLEL